MKSFIKKSVILFSPFILLILFIIYWDPFKIYWDYNDYYYNNRIATNRENICLQLFKKNIKTTNLNSFIIGSSRSQVYDATLWKNLLGGNKDEINPFHFDGGSLGLYRAYNIIKYLDQKVKKIDHVLLVVDNEYFSELNNPGGHLYSEPPEISGQSSFYYHLTFLKASLDLQFLYSNLIYKSTNRYYEFMGKHLDRNNYYHLSNNETADLYYNVNTVIKNDSIGYYKKLFDANVFYERCPTGIISDEIIKVDQRKIINEIAAIFKKHQTKVKVVISPLYTQIKINPTDLKFLTDTFGEENVSDFSGSNEFTRDITNYYESSHYKINVANEILHRVYQPLQR
jgi:hypothetical protein